MKLPRNAFDIVTSDHTADQGNATRFFQDGGTLITFFTGLSSKIYSLLQKIGEKRYQQLKVGI